MDIGFLGLTNWEKQESYSKVKNNYTFILHDLAGKTNFDINGGKYEYEGELDPQGKAVGYGTAVRVKNPDIKYSGQFLNNLRHGLCMWNRNLFHLIAPVVI